MLQAFINWFLGLFEPRYRPVYTDELPDAPKPYVLYVLGEGQYLWSAAMVCPCGCRELLQMSLHPEGRPRWKLIRHAERDVSLSPSVWRKVGCKSHFFLVHGKIKWCK